MFDVKVNTKQLLRFADRLGIASKAIETIKNRVGYAVVQHISKLAIAYIGTGGPIVHTNSYSIDGWRPLGKAGMASRQRNHNYGQLLKDTGAMRKSITYKYKNGYGFVTASNWKTGFHEQNGMPGSFYRAGGKFKGRRIYARPFLRPASEFVNSDLYKFTVEGFIQRNIDEILDGNRQSVSNLMIDYFEGLKTSPLKRVGAIAQTKQYRYNKGKLKTSNRNIETKDFNKTKKRRGK